VPKTLKGKYTVQISLATGTDLGMLASKKAIEVEYSQRDRKLDAHASLQKQLVLAMASKNHAKIDKARKALIKASFPKVIKPGQELVLNKQEQSCNDSYPGPDTLRAAVKFYPENDCLRVATRVIDANFSTKTPDRTEWEGSCIELFVSATGLDGDLVQLFAVPEGPENAPRMRGCGKNLAAVDMGGATGSWKRTDDGYELEVAIPWSKLPHYSKDGEFVTVEIAVDTKVPEHLCQLRSNGTINPQEHTTGFSRLTIR
jgi:hypothetical protein